MENRTRFIPSIIMLAAAFVACIMSIYYDYTTKEILLIVLGTIVVFFIIGIIVKVMADKYLITTMEAEIDESEEEKENSDSEENSMDDRDDINVETTPKNNKQNKK
ncbi:MAG: hypothetical protein HFI34_02500 [Lachnospiraceae bacterium]|nr:hypothetical protein [Lachnospiraceae bacterium]